MICSDIWHKYHERYFEIVIRAVRRVKLETILKYHEGYLCQISLQIMLLFVYIILPAKVLYFSQVGISN